MGELCEPQDRSSVATSDDVCGFDLLTPVLRWELEGGWNWELPELERGGIGSARSSTSNRDDK